MPADVQMLPAFAMKHVIFFLLRSPKTWRACSVTSKENLQVAKEGLIERLGAQRNQYCHHDCFRTRIIFLLAVSRKGDRDVITCLMQGLDGVPVLTLLCLAALPKTTFRGDAEVVAKLIDCCTTTLVTHWTPSTNAKIRYDAFKSLKEIVNATNSNAILFWKTALTNSTHDYSFDEYLLCIEGLDLLGEINDEGLIRVMEERVVRLVNQQRFIRMDLVPLFVLSAVPAYHHALTLRVLMRVLDDTVIVSFNYETHQDLQKRAFHALVRMARSQERCVINFLITKLLQYPRGPLSRLTNVVEALIQLGKKGNAELLELFVTTMLTKDKLIAQHFATLLPKIVDIGDTRAIIGLLRLMADRRRTGSSYDRGRVSLALLKLLEPCDQHLVPELKKLSGHPFYLEQVIRAVKEATHNHHAKGINVDLGIGADSSSTDQSSSSSESD